MAGDVLEGGIAFTGLAAGRLAAVGIALLSAGVVLMVSGRRRREQL